MTTTTNKEETNMKFNKSQKMIKKRVKTDKTELIPTLVISVKQKSPKRFIISILHPNTKKVLYSKTHTAKSLHDAFALGKHIKTTKFSTTKTWYEEILHVPRPRRGKMKLATKLEYDNRDKNNDSELN
jgi:hypothetical protein